MLLVSLYISRHGLLVQTSNNQADPRGEKFKKKLHLKCSHTEVFCARAGKMSQENYFFPPPFIGTNWFPPHSFVPTPVLTSFHDLTSVHKRVLPPIVETFRMLFFSTIQTKHTIANQQRIVIWHYEGRWNATCHELSCLEARHRPL